MAASPGPRRHLLTIALEDYFHVGAFNRIIQHGHWPRFETRLVRNTRRALSILDEHGARATFFVLGWVADTVPEVVQEVVARGHEAASSGYYHRSVAQMTPGEFREDLKRAREAIERASGTRVLGYRAAQGGLSPSDLWVLDVLAQEGYAYDSSIVPLFRAYRDEPWRRFAHRHRAGDREIWEFPCSSWDCLGWHIPIAGGNYFRQFPHTLVKRAVARWDRTCEAPFVMYFHLWELDPQQPRINAASLLARVRHYRNLSKMSWVLDDYLRRYRFTGIADYLELPVPALEEVPGGAPPRSRERVEAAAGPGTETGRGSPLPVTVVVPCFNEELVLPYLSNTLRSVEEEFAGRYELQFVFVDDGSRDGTWESLERLFGSRPSCTLVRHGRNKGVAASILTGIRNASTEVVCSIDCDCTYDPRELGKMIPLLEPGVDLVTASPYHPQGGVRNVPPWRLSLSRASSFLYRQVLRQKLHTYTSCFRVYRRSAAVRVDLWENGFLGVSELLGKLDLSGSRVVEHPAVLEARMLGRSKMKVLRTIVGHLGLLSRLLLLRWSRGGAVSAPRPALAGAAPGMGSEDRTVVVEDPKPTGNQP